MQGAMHCFPTGGELPITPCEIYHAAAPACTDLPSNRFCSSCGVNGAAFNCMVGEGVGCAVSQHTTPESRLCMHADNSSQHPLTNQPLSHACLAASSAAAHWPHLLDTTMQANGSFVARCDWEGLASVVNGGSTGCPASFRIAGVQYYNLAGNLTAPPDPSAGAAQCKGENSCVPCFALHAMP